MKTDFCQDISLTGSDLSGCIQAAQSGTGPISVGPEAAESESFLPQPLNKCVYEQDVTPWTSSVLTVPHRPMQMELKLPLQDDTGNLYCRPKKRTAG